MLTSSTMDGCFPNYSELRNKILKALSVGERDEDKMVNGYCDVAG
jgi:hypothetical protein